MPAKKEAVPELDDILAEIKEENTPPTPEDAQAKLRIRITELEELLTKEIEPKAISAEELRVHELEGILMQKQAIASITVGSFEDLKPGDKLLIHILAPNLTIAGRSWSTGDEILFTVGDDIWNQQFDRNGDTWLTRVFSDEEQIAKFGKVKYRPGPWTGPSQVKIPRGTPDIEAARIREAAERVRLAKRDVSSKK